MTDAVRKPWKLPLLPLTFPIHVFRLGLKRMGRRSLSEQIDSHNILKSNHCIVLFPTNGVGFGHFTRMYAVARALRIGEFGFGFRKVIAIGICLKISKSNESTRVY